jgi:hypothetical protein
MRWTRLTVSIIIALNGCDDDPFRPEDVAGFYPLASVDGHDVGWYHDVGAVDCQVAFIAGGLEILSSGKFDLDLDYNARCLGTDPFDASGSLRVFGSSTRKDGDVLILEGKGPDMIYPASLSRWTLEVHVAGSQLTVRFVGFPRTWWGDPILGVGPREELDE